MNEEKKKAEKLVESLAVMSALADKNFPLDYRIDEVVRSLIDKGMSGKEVFSLMVAHYNKCRAEICE